MLKFFLSMHEHNLDPIQILPSNKQKMASNCYQQLMMKHDTVCIFLNQVNWLYAGLLEGDPNVLHFVPRPFRLKIGRDRWIPDFYIAYKNKRVVCHINKTISWPDTKIKLLQDFLSEHNLVYESVLAESIYEREQEALGWLEIVRLLVPFKDTGKEPLDEQLKCSLLQRDAWTFGELTELYNLNYDMDRLLTLFRYIHNGKVKINSFDHSLNYKSVVSLCL